LGVVFFWLFFGFGNFERLATSFVRVGFLLCMFLRGFVSRSGWEEGEKGFEVLKKGYGWIGGGRKWAVELRFLECSRGEGRKKGVVGGEFGFLECSRGEKEEEEGGGGGRVGTKAGRRSGGLCLQEERGNRVWGYLECVWWGGGRVVDGARIV
jgi:hypothetical protein